MTKSVKTYPGKYRENWEEFWEIPGKNIAISRSENSRCQHYHERHESIVSFIGKFLNIPRFHHICILKVNKDTIFAKKVYWMRSKGRDKEIWLKFNRIFEIKTSHIFKNWAHLFWNSTCHNTRVCCKSLS